LKAANSKTKRSCVKRVLTAMIVETSFQKVDGQMAARRTKSTTTSSASIVTRRKRADLSLSKGNYT